MKKIIFGALFALVSLCSYGQTVKTANMTQATGATRDTITNAGTAYVATSTAYGATAWGFQAAITKVSGTVAGTIVLSGTIDGTNYHTIESQNLTDTSGTKYYIFKLDGSLAPYTGYRLTGSGGTTCVYYLDGKVSARQ